jgi:7-cyano-7-deazaguanine reductase
MMGSVHSETNPLGKTSEYPEQYDAGLLFPIDRNESWKASGDDRSAITFHGVDIWNGYEVSWLTAKGKPVVCVAEFRVPSDSPFLVESKSFKLYLNSFNQTRFENDAQVKAVMERDLSRAAGGTVTVAFHGMNYVYPDAPDAHCIDDIDVDISTYTPSPDLLAVVEGTQHDGWICSHLLKSNCPVTGQPDWGSIYIYYTGQEIDQASLLAYLVSLRQHQDFHEQCVERTFRDIQQRCAPESLTVYARYVRRGGLDINPFRTTEETFEALNFRLQRQ